MLEQLIQLATQPATWLGFGAGFLCAAALAALAFGFIVLLGRANDDLPYPSAAERAGPAPTNSWGPGPHTGLHPRTRHSELRSAPR